MLMTSNSILIQWEVFKDYLWFRNLDIQSNYENIFKAVAPRRGIYELNIEPNQRLHIIELSLRYCTLKICDVKILRHLLG